MRFELAKDVSPAEGIVDVYRALLDYAHECLVTRDADLNTAVHEVRKTVKKLRAVLLIVKPVLDKTAFKTADRAVRDFGRRLGGARDSAVLQASFNGLVEYYAPFLSVEDMQPIRENLESQYQLAMETFVASIDIHSLEEELEELRRRLDTLDLSGFSRHMLLASVRRTYRSGRRALQALHDEPSTENSHEFRRQAKYLWYQLRLLHKWSPAVLKPVVTNLDELGELLGQDHDLAILSDTLKTHPEISCNPIRAELVNGLAETRRIALLSAGLRIADGVYADKPASFINRLDKALQG
jgi:CHAD domain-containing protein